MIVLFRRKRVRIQQIDMPSGPTPAVEGILVGKPWRNAGHYVLRNPVLWTTPDSAVPFKSQEIWIPRERVILLEVHKS